MKRFDIRNPSRSVVIVVILLFSIGMGFLLDMLISWGERIAYPKPETYAKYVKTYAERFDVPEHVIYAVIEVESDFDADAVSDAGAVGLMQLMPDTFKWLTQSILFEYCDVGLRYDPETNIRHGTCYLSWLYERYGRWDLVFAAYNAGQGNVDEWLDNEEYADGEGGLAEIPFTETRNYVGKVTSAMEKYDRLYRDDVTDTEAATTAPDTIETQKNNLK